MPGAFLLNESPGGATWEKYCKYADPNVGSNGRVFGPWGECIHYAVHFQKDNQEWRELPGYSAAGPIDQVMVYLSECGYKEFAVNLKDNVDTTQWFIKRGNPDYAFVKEIDIDSIVVSHADLLAFNRNAEKTSAGNAEVHRLTAGSSFQTCVHESHLEVQMTNGHWVYLVTSSNNVMCIDVAPHLRLHGAKKSENRNAGASASKRSNSNSAEKRSGRSKDGDQPVQPLKSMPLEIHILSSKNKYGLAKSAHTSLHIHDPTDWDFLLDSKDNLVCLNKGLHTKSGKVELFWFNKRDGYEKLHNQVATPFSVKKWLPETAKQWRFAFNKSDDLIRFMLGDTNSDKMEMDVLSRTSDYASIGKHIVTCIQIQDADLWECMIDCSNNDALCVYRGAFEATSKTELHKLSAASRYQEYNLHASTGLKSTDATGGKWSFALTKGFDKEYVSQQARMRIQDVFKQWDLDGDGVIGKDELATVLKELNPAFNDEDLEAMLESMDKNGNGAVSYHEFLVWILGAEPTDDDEEDDEEGDDC